MENILEAKGLSKSFESGKNKSVEILKNISLDIKKGEFVSVMGPSGSGKSTLLYSISGMDGITSGSILFGGKEIEKLSEGELSSLRLHKMGFIFQQSHLLKDLNIFDNIVLSAYLAKENSREMVNNRARDLMKKTGIEQLADHDITQASGGQLQRVGICRALINNPDIVFGDEPTGALNSKATREIMEILKNINEAGTTILLVTHDAKVAARTERILFMLDGSIAGEFNLGKYDGKESLQVREERLASWLVKMGF
ncbi:ABC transporter ATP-binding protein [Anaeromicropila populeti]|uniref:Putative ABC transport system ATP-binding protein n=1 Tax=Anaeromicropila populeti TaxID=37658 RepID=A0A1I6LGU4_9FIRM|nr:ABC transporter ATP-binding protein [Anaeromicropila populeti]SFS02613.1 putative ABC transport system ATP-binding protein [Anaeromicropila populeti]